jgi:hypothetical protein
MMLPSCRPYKYRDRACLPVSFTGASAQSILLTYHRTALHTPDWAVFPLLPSLYFRRPIIVDMDFSASRRSQSQTWPSPRNQILILPWYHVLSMYACSKGLCDSESASRLAAANGR